MATAPVTRKPPSIASAASLGSHPSFLQWETVTQKYKPHVNVSLSSCKFLPAIVVYPSHRKETRRVCTCFCSRVAMHVEA